MLLELYGEFRSAGETTFDFYGEPWRAFVTEQHKYVVKGGEAGGEPWLLFDLDEDPYEQENLIDDFNAESVARDLHGLLRDRIAATGDDYVLAPAFGHQGLNRPPSIEE